METQHFEKGEDLMVQGEIGTELFIIPLFLRI